MTAETRHTVCPYDCPDSCGITAKVEGSRILSFGPRAEHPYTGGFLCRRGQEWPARMQGPGRITTPLLKSGEGWKTIGWDEAISRTVEGISRAMARHGHQSLLFYSYSGNLLLGNEAQKLFPALLGGCTLAKGSLCGDEGLSGLAATDPDGPRPRPESVLKSRGILLWGRNPAETNPHFMPFLARARQAGAAIGTVEIRTTPTTAFSDRSWLIRPGSDLALALYLCGQAIRCGGLPEGTENAEAFARMALSVEREGVLGQTGLDGTSLEELEAFVLGVSPLSIWMGWGPQRTRTGASLASVLDSLGMLTGNRGKEGGGVVYNQEVEGLLPEGLLDVPGANPRCLPRNGLGPALLSADPPVEAAFIVRGNPVSQCGDAGATKRFLESCPFSACLDYRMSLTARSCTLVLPVSLPLERGGDFVSSYWHDIVQETFAVCDPPEGVRHELDVIAEVAAGLGLPDRFHPAFEAIGRHIRSRKFLEPLSPGIWRARPEPKPQGTFRFPDFLDTPANPDGALRLVSVHVRDYTNGQDLRQAREPLAPPTATFSAADAERLGLAPGQRVTLENRRGNLTVTVALDPDRPTGTVVVAQAEEGLNTLVSPEVTARGHSCINETWVDLLV